MSLSKSEQYVIDLFQRRFGVELVKIPQSQGKSPDFESVRNGQRVFVAELKDIEYLSPSEDRGWTVEKFSDGSQSANRTDNAVSRVARKIHDAFGQLEQYSAPRVLIFLNHDPAVDVNDLEEAYTGEHTYGNEVFSYVNTSSKKIAEGCIREEKDKIDLYIWIDRMDERIWFRSPQQSGDDLARRLFPPAGQD